MFGKIHFGAANTDSRRVPIQGLPTSMWAATSAWDSKENQYRRARASDDAMHAVEQSPRRGLQAGIEILPESALQQYRFNS